MTRSVQLLATLFVVALLLSMAAVAAATGGPTFFDGSGDALPNEDCLVPKGDPGAVPAKPLLLSAELSADGTSATFTNVSGGCTFDVSLASYQIFEVYPANNTPVMESQMIFDLASTTVGPGDSVTLKAALPGCMAQVDAFYGDVITSFAYGARYSPRLLGARILGDAVCVHS